MFYVRIYRNYNPLDERIAHDEGSFTTYKQALKHAKYVVDSSLRDCYVPGMSEEELLEEYAEQGDDPYIFSDKRKEYEFFSARDYARRIVSDYCKTMTNNKQNNPDIDFEQELWKAANELRGAVAENQYKDYVLSLIFIKHLSDRYNIRRDQLFAKLIPMMSTIQPIGKRSATSSAIQMSTWLKVFTCSPRRLLGSI
jgi:hypothetical protein